ncbi:MAG: hypothetical protein M9919_02200 [Burkholderiaceae bacterium]|jgi:hypothetical protein|nr:hypothetical protein [Burkholderiaceae bacterium]MCO5102795.1 hypothetical protein [Burkholderiaceae bacterium]
MVASRSRSQLTVQSFGDVSRFLRSGVADEESRQLRDSIGALAQQIDEAIATRRAAPAAPAMPDTPEITRQAASLVQCVREHQLFVTGMGSAWHALYEMGAYQLALRSLRQAVEAWHHALAQRSPREGPAFDRVELLAWRTLGEGLLLIDMYEQGDNLHSEPAARPPPASAWQRAWAWLRKRGQ